MIKRLPTVLGGMCALMTVLASCGHVSKKSVHTKEEEKLRAHQHKPRKQVAPEEEDFWYTQARLGNVPVPLQAQPVSCAKLESKQYCLTFDTKLHRQELLDFYHDEMERLGWLQMADMSLPNELLIFGSPDALIAISLVPGHGRSKRTRVAISLCKKEGRADASSARSDNQLPADTIV